MLGDHAAPRNQIKCGKGTRRSAVSFEDERVETPVLHRGNEIKNQKSKNQWA
jgi:hypothetical protein